MAEADHLPADIFGTAHALGWFASRHRDDVGFEPGSAQTVGDLICVEWADVAVGEDGGAAAEFREAIGDEFATFSEELLADVDFVTAIGEVDWDGDDWLHGLS